MARTHLLLGPVGAGKSTLLRELCTEHRAVGFDLDDWMATLFGADERPLDGILEWYVARTARCNDQIWRVATSILDSGTDVVLELGLVRRGERETFFGQLDSLGHDLTIYCLDAPRELRKARVEARNVEQGATFSMVVPPAIFEIASDMWQPLDPDECAGREVQFLSTGG